jgi:hypothetical protein
MDKKPAPRDLRTAIKVPLATPLVRGRRRVDKEPNPEVLPGWDFNVLPGWDVEVEFGAYARMESADWHDPRLREIGRAGAKLAGELAYELERHGARASALLTPKARKVKPPFRRESVEIPMWLADTIMAVLLAQARKDQGRGPRRVWEPIFVQRAFDGGMSLRAAARQEAARAGVPIDTIMREMRKWRATRARRK